jgi:hypothetical protein
LDNFLSSSSSFLLSSPLHHQIEKVVKSKG